MLSRQTVAAVSGINGVAWDAVELPSQFLENWCWDRAALAFISGHHASGEPLPEALLDKLLAARNFQSAMIMARQLEFSCSISVCTGNGRRRKALAYSNYWTRCENR